MIHNIKRNIFVVPIICVAPVAYASVVVDTNCTIVGTYQSGDIVIQEIQQESSDMACSDSAITQSPEYTTGNTIEVPGEYHSRFGNAPSNQLIAIPITNYSGSLGEDGTSSPGGYLLEWSSFSYLSPGNSLNNAAVDLDQQTEQADTTSEDTEVQDTPRERVTDTSVRDEIQETNNQQTQQEITTESKPGYLGRLWQQLVSIFGF